METENDKPVKDQPQAASAGLDASRRHAMLKMAAYTAPVMLAMLTSEKAMAVSPVTWTWKPPVE
jgi:hypothetical protein